MGNGKRRIFVFGSNLAGRHGKGSALAAKIKYGAIQGQGYGLQGNSFAIPTKDGRHNADLRDPRQILPLSTIEYYVQRFLSFARDYPELEFHVVAIGCGLGGYKPEQIAPFFKEHPTNVYLPKEFVQVLQAL